MDHISASAETLMKQASMTADEYFRAAIRNIDAQFGPGYAEANPALVGAFMNAASRDFGTSMLAAVIQDVDTNVLNISEALDRVAAALGGQDR